MTERSVTLFEIVDRRRVPQSHVASQVFDAGEKEEANKWLRNLSRMFPKEEFDEAIKIFSDDAIEVTSFKIHVEYRRRVSDSDTSSNSNTNEPTNDGGSDGA